MSETKLVLDSNILFSIFKPDSVNSYLFSTLRAKFFAPEYIKSEIDKYNSECLSKSKLSEYEFKTWQKEIENRVKFIKIPQYKRFLKKAIDSSIDP